MKAEAEQCSSANLLHEELLLTVHWLVANEILAAHLI